MLRVVGAAGDAATRIENRIATPAANPYLALTGLIAAGLDGITRRLDPPPATLAPYAVDDVALLPRSLALALDELPRDRAIADALGAPLVEAYLGIKRNECRRHAEAEDPVEWQRREYLGRL
jgi:glutamine synthetase